MIGVLKRTLHFQLQAGRLMSPLQTQSFLHRAAALVNERPIGVRAFSEQDYMAITPRDLLLGAKPELSPAQQAKVGLEDDPGTLAQRVAEVEKRVDLWWTSFYHDVFPLLVPLRKWYEAKSDLDVGSIVMVWYPSKMAHDRYRLGRVVGIKRGTDGLVRTAEVALRNLHKGAREVLGQCKAGVTRIVLPIQRLVVLLPGKDCPQVADRLVPTQPGPDVISRPGALRVRAPQADQEILDLAGHLKDHPK